MMNRTILVGRLTKDPELSYTPNGIAKTTFMLAVNRSFTNQAGEREADFILIEVWRKPAENCANFLKKGSLAGVDGKIQTRNFEGRDGKRVWVTTVVAESVQFLEPKNSNSGQSQGNQQQNRSNQQQNNNSNTRVDEDPFANDGQPIDISDSDLPF